MCQERKARHVPAACRWPRYICLFMLLLASTRGFSARASDEPSIEAAVLPASGSITLDGRLEEPIWRDAPVLKLTQQSPKPGEPTPFETEVRVVVTSDRVYLAFHCKDPDPRQIAVHTMRRDQVMRGDDTVSIVLDTYGDHRTGYFFQINAAGARADGLISDPQSASLDWDGIWDARTARTADGWSAEIVIPSRTLNFAGGVDEWGLNVERFVPRERLTLRWSSPTLDSFIYDLSRAGRLTGVGALEQGKGLEFVPYATGKTRESFPGSDRSWQGSAGGDVTWKITPQRVKVFTSNTEFAETEVDTRQINLTRFPLFFPEKRAFFLEGANQYDFGLGIGGQDSPQFIPFFSRRIGLLGGAQIPINAGVKLNGRVGKWNLALLDVQTRETSVRAEVAQELALPSVLVPSTNLLAGRVSYDFNENLRVGTSFTHGDPEGLRQNTFVGFDAIWRTSKFRRNKNFLVGAWGATTQGDVGPGSKLGWGFKIDYPNDLWDCATSGNQYGDALEPLLGFLPRARARQETEQRFQSVAVLINAGRAVPKVIGIVDFESPPQFASRTNVALRGGAPCTHQKILVPSKFGSAPNGIETHKRVLTETLWIAMRETGANAKIFIEIVRHAAREQIGAGHQNRRECEFLRHLRPNRGFTGLHVEQREVPFSHPAVQLHPRVDGNLCAAKQSDPAAEEGNELRRILASNAQSKIVLVGPFEKERSLLRKEKRKPREIDLPRIDFRLGEVRVGGEHRDELRCDFPRHVAAGRTLPRPVASWKNFPRFSRRIRDELQSFALFERSNSGQSPRAAQIVDKGIERGGRPSQGQPFPRNESFYVQSPLVDAAREV